MKRLLALVALIGATSLPTLAQETPAAPTSPADAVFRIIVITHTPDGRGYKAVGSGTAFFVGADGTALTNEHVVYRAQTQPDTYSLLAIVGDEFYGASIVCGTRLAYDPTAPHPTGITVGHDLAVIRLTPPSFPFHRWGDMVQGQFLEIAHEHVGPLPAFATLTLHRFGPGVGDTVQVVGFGHISPIAQKWTATGTVREEGRTSDGTHVFQIQFTTPAQPGNSGSPVLNTHGEVVGMDTWSSLTRSDMGVAQSVTALNTSCR